MLLRNNNNPIITRNDVPDLGVHLRNVSSVFNPGAVKMNHTYHLMLRVQNRARETFLMMADSSDGINFTVRPELVNFKGIEQIDLEVYHIYDPRITRIDDIFYILFAIDTSEGTKLGLAKSDDLINFDFIDIVSQEDNRNGVLFPELINGYYARLDRPNIVKHDSVMSGNFICLSFSKDMKNWERESIIIEGRPHYWDELIGAGTPPIKTKDGWLIVYHGVATHFSSSNIYQAGVFILDLDDPSKVLARSKYNILEPRKDYELMGQVPNVVFPSGIIVEDSDASGFASENSQIKIYYGAADTSICLAEIELSQLVRMAKNE